MGRRNKSKRTEGGRSTRAGPPPDARRRRSRAVGALAAVALAVALIAGGLLFRGLTSGGGPAGPQTAAIVDHLSLTFPNPGFAQEATDLLEQAGYTVDYYPGEEVTVGFYRSLPDRGYDFILLRSHSARRKVDGALTDEATLFTSEIYVEEETHTKYPEEMTARRLGIARYDESDEVRYVDVRAGFIEEDTKGRFKDSTVVVLMGCDALRSDRLAEAFLGRGAKTVIGWDAAVSADYTDEATERLLEKLLIAGLSADDAVRETMSEVGPDPGYGAELRVLAAGG